MTNTNDVLKRLRNRTSYGTHWDGCETEHDICATIAVIEQLTAQIARDQADAERYRFLRRHREPQQSAFINKFEVRYFHPKKWSWYYPGDELLDAAIDAARAQEGR